MPVCAVSRPVPVTMVVRQISCLLRAACLVVQNRVNEVLQQYVSHLVQTEQQELVPVYACHMRQDVRRETYSAYFHRLTHRDMAQCWAAFESAQRCFSHFPRGDIDGGREVESICGQVSCACAVLAQVLLRLVARVPQVIQLMCPSQLFQKMTDAGHWQVWPCRGNPACID